ncbi:cold and drought-regulated protein CORA-like [Harmonia axyridis]|uniref:cold and drought-regulated protein CORA-like n=1 Tax=Harmonia axyridis TaxID=115357 RepID=UPI001E276AE3|nr:cold and drought-regulated protein CORA-like [Harmonia axyridis]
MQFAERTVLLFSVLIIVAAMLGTVLCEADRGYSHGGHRGYGGGHGHGHGHGGGYGSSHGHGGGHGHGGHRGGHGHGWHG